MDTTIHQQGGCLCGSIRYVVRAEPLRVMICHCTACQKITGSAYMVEPIFQCDIVELTGVKPKVFDHRSDGSGKRVSINFCGNCGSSLFLEFERFPEVLGMFAGTFDDPNWFHAAAVKSAHIFTSSAQAGVVIPAGVATFEHHAIDLDGKPRKPVVHPHPQPVTRRG